MLAAIPSYHDDHDGRAPRRLAAGFGTGYGVRNAPASRNHDRRRPDGQPAPDAIHHACRLSVSGSAALVVRTKPLAPPTAAFYAICIAWASALFSDALAVNECSHGRRGVLLNSRRRVSDPLPP